MSCSFTKQELAQHVLLRSWKETTAYKNDLHLLPIQLNELAAHLHLLALGAVLTVFTQEHADYPGMLFVLRRAPVGGSQGQD